MTQKTESEIVVEGRVCRFGAIHLGWYIYSPEALTHYLCSNGEWDWKNDGHFLPTESAARAFATKAAQQQGNGNPSVTVTGFGRLPTGPLLHIRLMVEENASLRQRCSELEQQLAAARRALEADNCPTPQLQSYPLDPFAEEYRRWYHGTRADALASTKE